MYILQIELITIQVTLKQVMRLVGGQDTFFLLVLTHIFTYVIAFSISCVWAKPVRTPAVRTVKNFE